MSDKLNQIYSELAEEHARCLRSEELTNEEINKIILMLNDFIKINKRLKAVYEHKKILNKMKERIN